MMTVPYHSLLGLDKGQDVFGPSLQEEPRNGYQIMQELKQRSRGTFGRMTRHS